MKPRTIIMLALLTLVGALIGAGKIPADHLDALIAAIVAWFIKSPGESRDES